MKFVVFLISDAEKDIIDIYKYIIFSDSKEKAECVFHKIEETCKSLYSLCFRWKKRPSRNLRTSTNKINF